MDDDPPVKNFHFLFPNNIKALDVLLHEGIEPKENKDKTFKSNFQSIRLVIKDDQIHLNIAEHKKNILPKI